MDTRSDVHEHRRSQVSTHGSQEPQSISDIIRERDFYKQACDRRTAIILQRSLEAHDTAIKLEKTTHERDMLARRCAEQAHQIAALTLALKGEPQPPAHSPVFAAIEVHQRQGAR